MSKEIIMTRSDVNIALAVVPEVTPGELPVGIHVVATRTQARVRMSCHGRGLIAFPNAEQRRALAAALLHGLD